MLRDGVAGYQPGQVFRRNSRELRPGSLDSANRRVQSVLTTEDPALVFDWRRYELVLEVLLMDDVAFETDTPLLLNHNSYNVDNIVGSVTDHDVRGDEIMGWLSFLHDVDERTEATWRRVEQGALRRVSVGYDYDREDYTTIPAGETQTVRGRTLTAPDDRDLRVVYRWRLLEVSLVVIPADPRAQMRAAGGGEDGEFGGTYVFQGAESAASRAPHALDSAGSLDSESQATRRRAMKNFLAFCHRHGMAKSVKSVREAIAWASDGNLTATQIRSLAQLAKDEDIEFDERRAKAKRRRSTSHVPSGTSDSDSGDGSNVSGGAANSSGGATATATRTARSTRSRNDGGDPGDDGGDAGGDGFDDGGGDGDGANARAGNGGTRGASRPARQAGRTTARRTQAGGDGADLAREFARQAVTDERERVAAIREMASDWDGAIPDEVLDRCEHDGLSVDESRAEFLTALRDRRGLFDGTAPAGHARGSEDVTMEVLQAAILSRSDVRVNGQSIDPDAEILQSDVVRNIGRQRDFQIGWLLNQPSSGPRRDRVERAFEIVDQRGLRNISMMRAAELMVEIETGRRHYEQDDILERAFSSGGYTAVYGSVVHLMMMAAYETTANSYSRIAQVVDVGDFREHKTADMGYVGRLRRQGYNGGQAPLLNIDDPLLLAIVIERYAGQLKITDQMIIDDALGVTGFIPTELGETCVDMIDDLVWAQVLRTDVLADGNARYNASPDGNLITATTLDEAAWTALGAALKGKKVQGRRIRVREGLIAAGLNWTPTVRKWMNSTEVRTDGQAINNPFRGAYDVLEDTAIDLGVDDPSQDDLAIAGIPDSIFAFSASESKRPIKVAFRRGTNRGPVTRRFELDKGEWGVGWDVYMDMGAKFQRRIGTVQLDLS